MACPSLVHRGTLADHLALDLESGGMELWALRDKVDHTSERVAAVQHAARPHDDLCLGHGKRVDGGGILKMSSAVNGVVHPHTIHHKQHSVGLKSTQDRADSALLAHLQMDLSSGFKQIACGLHRQSWRLGHETVQRDHGRHAHRARGDRIGLDHHFFDFKGGRLQFHHT